MVRSNTIFGSLFVLLLTTGFETRAQELTSHVLTFSTYVLQHSMHEPTVRYGLDIELRGDSAITTKWKNDTLLSRTGEKISADWDRRLDPLLQFGTAEWQNLADRSRGRNNCDTAAPIKLKYFAAGRYREFEIRNAGNCYPPDVSTMLSALNSWVLKKENE